MNGTAPKAWPLRRLLLAAYVGLLGAALFAVSLGIRGLVGRYLYQALEHSAREATAESWARLGMPPTEFWSLPRQGGVIITQRLSSAQLEALVRDLARPERIVRWRGVGSSVVVQAGGRQGTGVRLAPPPPDVYWWGLTITTPQGTIGVLEMGLDRRADRHLLEALGRYLFLCSGAVLMMAVLICFRLSNYWLAPLKGLNKTFEELASGDLSARPPEIEGGVVPVEWRQLRQNADRMANRLEASFNTQRRFISDASHELRTPLTAVAAMAEMLESDNLNPQSRAKAQSTILRESLRMSRLVEDLLALSRADEARLLASGSCGLSETFASIEDELSESHPGRTLNVICSPSAEVKAPPTLVRTVLRNLVENAFRYSDEVVTCRVVEVPGQVEVTVEDTGCGIPEDELDKVFDRFYRSDHSRSRATGGSGLGLAIVKLMVEQTGGEVSLSSRLGQGTTVRVVWRETANV